MMENRTQKHCINVLKLFDWITKPVNIQLSESLERQVLVNDQICGNIDIPCGENALLWMVKGKLSVSGSVTVCHQMGCEHMEVIVNGRTVFILTREEEQTMNFSNLRSIEVRCKGNENGLCIGKYCLTLHYNLNKSYFSLGDCQVTCFLSDEFGNPTDSLVCQEITQTIGRRNIEVTLPNGETVVLQKVKVLKKGFITVQIVNKGKVCNLCIIPFQVVEKLLLYAPLGTFIKCEVTDFECAACFTDDCKSLDIEISFCQQVQVMANVKMEVEANLCFPRSETDIYPCSAVHDHL
ncbi:DUF3992 domain-containing protein [Virgibacillus pantothenticus]|uniref:DUF3992 domain-containing protein n=1 Tax=Virgibacillus pantothenticus TaxID=1473 RepID=UPI000986A28A|nr:S-Ena type endospore appendage [Virgibacillus pantothenticus]